MGQTDEEAFRALVQRHRDLIWSVCSSYRLSAAWEVEDAFHEVLCDLWLDFRKFRGNSSERTWVFRVATNTMISLKRRISNQPTPEAPPVDRAAPSNENYQYLLQLIDSLDEPDGRIVRAHWYGFGYSEIARMTGLSVAAVSMRLTRAKRRIKKMYEN